MIIDDKFHIIMKINSNKYYNKLLIIIVIIMIKKMIITIEKELTAMKNTWLVFENVTARTGWGSHVAKIQLKVFLVFKKSAFNFTLFLFYSIIIIIIILVLCCIKFRNICLKFLFVTIFRFIYLFCLYSFVCVSHYFYVLSLAIYIWATMFKPFYQISNCAALMLYKECLTIRNILKRLVVFFFAVL